MDIKNKNLNDFISNNQLEVSFDDKNNIVLEKAWSDDSILLIFNQADSFEGFEKILLNNKLVALFHNDLNEQQQYEFIYQPLLNTNNCIGRVFSFNYEGKEFHARYDKPTEVFEKIARGFRRRQPESDSNYRNLLLFRDFYEKENLKEAIQLYFKDRVPINFHVVGPFSAFDEEKQITLMRHLNFYMKFYDRWSPEINILRQNNSSENYSIPCKSQKEPFPNHLNILNIDNIVLSILQTARYAESNRLGYIFYYQVLEYCAYYYMDADFKRQISTIIRQPDLYINWDKYLPEFIEKFQTNFNPKGNNSDSSRMDKVICEYCYMHDIEDELQQNVTYFSQEQQFDGGFSMPPLLPNGKVEEGMDIRALKLRERLEKIRNVLVHARESRENCVILPSEENDNKLLPYLCLIRRMAETIAFRYNQPLKTII